VWGVGCGVWEMGDGRWEMGDGRWEMGDHFVRVAGEQGEKS